MKMSLTETGNVLKRMIAEQCIFYDSGLGVVGVPEARLLMGVIDISITDLSIMTKKPPVKPITNDTKALRRYISRGIAYQEALRECRDAKDFFFSERLEDFTALLGLDAEWIRRKVRMFIAHIKKEHGAPRENQD